MINFALKFFRLLLLIIGVVLIIDCSVLLFLFKINFGTVIPLVIGLIFVIHAIYWQAIQNFIGEKPSLTWAWYGCWAVFTPWLITFIIFVATLLQQINNQPVTTDVKAVIILGAGVNGDKPTPALASRLDKSAEIIDIQKEFPLIVTTGGIGFGREVSEADVMARYLHEQYGISMERILREGKSTSTEENLAFTKTFLLQSKINPKTAKIAIVTNDFHTIRAKAIAKKQGYGNVVMMASSTPVSIRGNAWFREYFAFVSGWLLNEY